MKILRCFLFGLLTTSLVAAHAVTLDLSSYLGGDGEDTVFGVAVDAGGDIYATGRTTASDFPGADTGVEGNGVFVSRVDRDGRGVVFTTILDGRNDEFGLAIAVDDLGAAYVTGETGSRDFPLLDAFEPSFNPGTLTNLLAKDAFVTKLDASGTIVFSTYLGGRDLDRGDAIALDRDRRPYVAGSTRSNNFPLENEFQDAGGLFTAANAFLTVFAADGQSLAYSTQLGGSEGESGQDLAVDRAGNAYLAGGTTSGDFPVKSPFQSAFRGGTDAWVAKFDPASSGAASLIYSTYLGGTGIDEALGIAVDAAGQAHVTGRTNSSSFPLAAPAGRPVLDSTIAGQDGFVTKLNTRGNGLLFSSFLGGSGFDRGNSLAVDGAGATYVVGLTASTDFPTVNEFQSALAGPRDAFVAKIDPLTAKLLWSSFLGGLDSEDSFTVALDPRANVYLGGVTASGATFPLVAAFQEAYGGEPGDGFLARIEATPPDTIGTFETDGKILLRNSNTEGGADLIVTLGQAGDLPVAGSWFGFGDRPGIFRDGTFILKRFNNDLLCCNLIFNFGQAGDQPLAGDWNGDGIDTVGVFTSTGEFQLINSNAFGEPELVFAFGLAGDVPLAGDWNGDGIDTIGVFRPSTLEFFFRNTNDAGGVDVFVAGFAQVGDLPVVGDWDGDGITTIGVFRGNQFLLRNSNSAGPADLSFVFGIPGDLPIAGDWNGRP
jgi:hypothetical protein